MSEAKTTSTNTVPAKQIGETMTMAINKNETTTPLLLAKAVFSPQITMFR